MWPKLHTQPKCSPDLLSFEGMRVTWSQGTLGMEVMKQRRYPFLHSLNMLWVSASLLCHMYILDITFCPHVSSATWRDWPSTSVDSSQLFYLMIPSHFLQRFILQRNPYFKIGGGGRNQHIHIAYGFETTAMGWTLAPTLSYKQSDLPNRAFGFFSLSNLISF